MKKCYTNSLPRTYILPGRGPTLPISLLPVFWLNPDLPDGNYLLSVIFFCCLTARALVPIATARALYHSSCRGALAKSLTPFLTVFLAHLPPMSPSYDMLQSVVSEPTPHITTEIQITYLTSISRLFAQSQRFLKVLETKVPCVLQRWYPQQYIYIYTHTHRYSSISFTLS